MIIIITNINTIITLAIIMQESEDDQEHDEQFSSWKQVPECDM